MPRISIIIPCYNGARWLAAAIDSCLAQTARDFEVVIVDDGSIDASHAVATMAASADSRVKVIRQENRGLGAARNAGLAIAQGEYVNFLDADDSLEPEKLAIQSAVLDENPHIDCVFCNGVGIDADDRVVMDGLYDPRRLAGPIPMFELFFSGGQFPPLIPLIRTRVAREAGGFDADRRASGWADTGFWLRVGLTHARYHFVDASLCRYRVHPGNMSSNPDAMERSAELVYAKLLRDRPEESARALRFVHRRLIDNEVALSALRASAAHAERDLRDIGDQWRITRETLHAEQVESNRLRDELRETVERLARLRTVVADRSRSHVENQALRQVLRGFMHRIVICGAGDSGTRLWEALATRPTVDVVGFVDPDVRRHGRDFLGAAIQSPAWLRDGGWDMVAVDAARASEWRPLLAAAGVETRRVIELPGADGEGALGDIVAAMFPDPLAQALAGAELARGMRVGIFGTGAAGMKVWEVLTEMDTADAVWFADNNVKQQGRQILGLDVIAPADVFARGFNAVVVASMARDPIRKQLRRLGVASRDILMPDVTGSIEQLRSQLAAAIATLMNQEDAA